MKIFLRHSKSAKNTEAYSYAGDPLMVPAVGSVYVSRAHLLKEFQEVPEGITVEISKGAGFGPAEPV